MKTLLMIAEALDAFDSDDEKYIEELPAEEAEAAGAELQEMGEEDFGLYALPAYISYAGRCGFASAGTTTYVSNRRRDRSVRATVRVRWRRGINTGSYDRVKTIPAGSRVLLGCTRGGGPGDADFSYSVIGAQVI